MPPRTTTPAPSIAQPVMRRRRARRARSRRASDFSSAVRLRLSANCTSGSGGTKLETANRAFGVRVGGSRSGRLFSGVVHLAGLGPRRDALRRVVIGMSVAAAVALRHHPSPSPVHGARQYRTQSEGHHGGRADSPREMTNGSTISPIPLSIRCGSDLPPSTGGAATATDSAENRAAAGAFAAPAGDPESVLSLRPANCALGPDRRRRGRSPHPPSRISAKTSSGKLLTTQSYVTLRFVRTM